MQRLLSMLRETDQKYALIPDHTRVAVGVSGGKDSLLLLELLARYRAFCPRSFTLTAVTLRLSDQMDVSPVQSLCDRYGIPFVCEKNSVIEELLAGAEASPCSLCARVRRGTLLRIAREQGCGLLALGHHRDDVIETWAMSILFGGRTRILPPKEEMSQSGITLIRPLYEIPEKKLSAAAERLRLTPVLHACPFDGRTRRTEVREMLSHLEERYPEARERIFHAILSGEMT